MAIPGAAVEALVKAPADVVWCFADATRLRFRLILGPGQSGTTSAIEWSPEKERRIIARQIDEHRANTQLVVDTIETAAEAARPKRDKGGTRAPLS